MTPEPYISYANFGKKIIGMVALKITAVPESFLLSEKEEDAIASVKQVFAATLREISHQYGDHGIALELLWFCRPAVNQPFRSFVEMMLVFRATGDTAMVCQEKLVRVCRHMKNVLDNQKILSAYGPVGEYEKAISPALEGIYSVRRRDEITPLAFGSCYHYDMITPKDNDLGGLVNALINESNQIVSIQLIPTMFSAAEMQYINATAQSLSTLVRGMPVPRMGIYQIQGADIPLRTYRKYQEMMRDPMMYMNIMVCGQNGASASIASQIMAIVGEGDEHHRTDLELCDLSAYREQFMQIHASPWLMLDRIISHARGIQTHQRNQTLPMVHLAYKYAPSEVAQIFRLPIGTKQVTAGVILHDVYKRHKVFAGKVVDASDLPFGRLRAVIGREDSYIGVMRQQLTEHMLVVGASGSGKSTFLVGVLDQAWRRLNVPFLVIEPTKSEYRALLDTIPNLQIFTPGNSQISPLIINPFIPPKGVTVEKYKTIVKEAFTAAFDMVSPLDQLIEETLMNCYHMQGWLDSQTVEPGTPCFSLADFIQEFKRVTSSKKYSNETRSNVEQAGVVRLQGLLNENINIFDTRYTISIQDLLESPTVIELKAVKNQQQKSFIIALLLNNIYAYVEDNFPNQGLLRNMILLEEAHALLGADTTKQEGTANASAAAVRLFTNMLKEIRSRGVGMVISDQSPKKVTQDVVAGTAIKVAFQLTEEGERTMLAESTAMNEIQKRRLVKLTRGQAFVFFRGLDEAEEIMTDNYRDEHGIRTDLPDKEVVSRMTYWQTRKTMLKPYPDCDAIYACAGDCNPQAREMARMIAHRIFKRYGDAIVATPEACRQFFSKKLKALIAQDAADNRILLTPRTQCCIRVHLMRFLHHETQMHSEKFPQEKLAIRLKYYQSFQPSTEENDSIDD